MKRVLIVGATGQLGRYLCEKYQQRGWYVIALDREATDLKPIAADQQVAARVSDPTSLFGVMDGVDLVVSCLGIKFQANGRDCRDVDYQSNSNLMREADRAGVARVVYAHLLGVLDKAQVLRALDLNEIEGCQGNSRLTNDGQSNLTATPAAVVHQLTAERKEQ